MIKTFVKKPVKVQAVQWTGDNYEELADFVGHIRFTYSLEDLYEILLHRIFSISWVHSNLYRSGYI